MHILHTARRLTTALIAAVFLLLSSLGLSMVTMTAASAVIVFSEEGSEASTGSASAEPEPEPEPSDSPEPPPSSSPEHSAPSPDPAPAEEPEPKASSNDGPADGPNEPAPSDSSEPTTSSLTESSDIGTEKVATLSAVQVEELVVALIAIEVMFSTQVSAAEVLVGEPFFDTATVTVPSAVLIDSEVFFELFGPDDESCTGPVVFASGPHAATSFSATATATSNSFVPTEPGTYRFRAGIVGSYFSEEDPGSAPVRTTFRAQQGCNEPNESVLVLAPPDPDPDDGDDDDGDGGEDADDGDGDGKKSHNHADPKAALPNTGASDHLNLIGGTGIALTLAGMVLVAATPRRRAGTHRA